MTDPLSPVTWASRTPNFDALSGSSPALHLSGPSASSLYGSDGYEPLPPGRWEVPFHGNCPRCHHYHRAVQIHINVTSDSRHVNYIHCEHCQNRWAAFGGRNSTRVSLLSTTTNELDPVHEEVRYSFYDIVKMATAKAAIGALREQSHPGPSRQPTHGLPFDSEVHTSLACQEPHKPAPQTEHGSKIEASQKQKCRDSTASPAVQQAIAARGRSSTGRLFSKIKVKLGINFGWLHRRRKEQTVSSSNPPAMTPRQFQKSSVKLAPPTSLGLLMADEPDSRHQMHSISSPNEAVIPDSPGNRRIRLYEVVDFIRSLDKTVLDSLTDSEREQWMRKAYAEFKARRNRKPLLLSPVVETNCTEPLSLRRERLGRYSSELFGAGAHAEGFEAVALRRRNSLAISAHSVPEYSLITSLSTPGPLQRFQSRGSQRPQSLCSGRRSLSRSRAQSLCSVRPQSRRSTRSQSLRRPRSPSLRSIRSQSLRNGRQRSFLPRTRQVVRRSFESLLHGAGGSTLSMRAQRSSRMSQDTTLYGSVTTLVNNWLDTSLPPESNSPADDIGSTPIGASHADYDLLPPVVDSRSTTSPERDTVGASVAQSWTSILRPDTTNESASSPFDPITLQDQAPVDTQMTPTLLLRHNETTDSIIDTPYLTAESSSQDLATKSPSGSMPEDENLLVGLEEYNVQGHGAGSRANHDGAASYSFQGHDDGAPDQGEGSRPKRSRRHQSDDNEDNDKHKRKRKQRHIPGREEPPTETFACPFPKQDPLGNTRCWGFAFETDRFCDLR
jgi:hypothetical protein